LTKGQLYFYVLQKRTTPLYAQLGLLGLTLLEQPGFCREGGCEAARAGSLYSWHLPLLPPAVATGSAMLFWLVLLWRMLLQRKALGAAYFLGYGVAQWTAFGYAVVVLGMASTLASFFSGSVSAHDVAILFRPLIIISSNKKLRFGFSDIAESLPGIVDVVCSLFLAIFIFVWIGMMLFVKFMNEGRSKEQLHLAEESPFGRSLHKAIAVTVLALFVVLSAAIFVLCRVHQAIFDECYATIDTCHPGDLAAYLLTARRSSLA